MKVRALIVGLVVLPLMAARVAMASAAGPVVPALTDKQDFVVLELSADVRAYVTGKSWKRSCPVPLDDLRLVVVRYVDFAGATKQGPLVVNRKYADDIASVMATLYRERFPIEHIALVDDYGANDDRSTLANNTSAFNCRSVQGTSHWSQHAFGAAIDINPLQNPYVRATGRVLDPKAVQFKDRSLSEPGMITAGGPVTEAFTKIGWGWGGSFSTTKDYQHFSSNGR